MKKSAKAAFAAIVTLLIINTVMQAVMPAGEIFMVIATMIVLIGANLIIRSLDDQIAEKYFRKIQIAWVGFEVIFGPTVLMLLVGAALAYHEYRKKNAKEAAKEAAKDQESGQ